MVFRDGDALPEHGVDWLIVECEGELVNALADGWREELAAPETFLRHPVSAIITDEGTTIVYSEPVAPSPTPKRRAKK